jgi:glycerol kinase
MTASDLLMQFQSDILNLPVARSAVPETTALGAAYAAGLAVGFWNSLDDLREQRRIDRRWEPKMDESTRQRLHGCWLKAIERCVGWLE